MTRAEIRAEWSVSSRGIIMTPGKFEGCQDFVPHFWGLAAGGCADETVDARNGSFDVFTVDAAALAEWPELEDAHSLVLWEDESGFVHAVTIAEPALVKFRAECAQSLPADEESCTEER